MAEFATSRLADERLAAAVAELNRNAAESRRRRREMRAQEERERRRFLEQIGEPELDGRRARGAGGNGADGEHTEEGDGTTANVGRGASRIVAPRPPEPLLWEERLSGRAT